MMNSKELTKEQVDVLNRIHHVYKNYNKPFTMFGGSNGSWGASDGWWTIIFKSREVGYVFDWHLIHLSGHSTYVSRRVVENYTPRNVEDSYSTEKPVAAIHMRTLTFYPVS